MHGKESQTWGLQCTSSQSTTEVSTPVITTGYAHSEVNVGKHLLDGLYNIYVYIFIYFFGPTLYFSCIFEMNTQAVYASHMKHLLYFLQTPTHLSAVHVICNTIIQASISIICHHKSYEQEPGISVCKLCNLLLILCLLIIMMLALNLI